MYDKFYVYVMWNEIIDCGFVYNCNFCFFDFLFYVVWLKVI